MRRLLLCAATTVLIGIGGCSADTPPEAKPSTTSELAGDWVGTLTGNSGDDFLIEVSVSDPLTVGQSGTTVSYPNLVRGGCSGTWTYNGPDEGSYTFAESITDNAGGACVSGGKITLTPSETDTLQLLFEGEGAESNGVLSQGVLPQD